MTATTETLHPLQPTAPRVFDRKWKAGVLRSTSLPALRLLPPDRPPFTCGLCRRTWLRALEARCLWCRWVPDQDVVEAFERALRGAKRRSASMPRLLDAAATGSYTERLGNRPVEKYTDRAWNKGRGNKESDGSNGRVATETSQSQCSAGRGLSPPLHSPLGSDRLDDQREDRDPTPHDHHDPTPHSHDASLHDDLRSGSCTPQSMLNSSSSVASALNTSPRALRRIGLHVLPARHTEKAPLRLEDDDSDGGSDHDLTDDSSSVSPSSEESEDSGPIENSDASPSRALRRAKHVPALRVSAPSPTSMCDALATARPKSETLSTPVLLDSSQQQTMPSSPHPPASQPAQTSQGDLSSAWQATTPHASKTSLFDTSATPNWTSNTHSRPPSRSRPITCVPRPTRPLYNFIRASSPPGRVGSPDPGSRMGSTATSRTGTPTPSASRTSFASPRASMDIVAPRESMESAASRLSAESSRTSLDAPRPLLQSASARSSFQTSSPHASFQTSSSATSTRPAKPRASAPPSLSHYSPALSSERPHTSSGRPSLDQHISRIIRSSVDVDRHTSGSSRPSSGSSRPTSGSSRPLSGASRPLSGSLYPPSAFLPRNSFSLAGTNGFSLSGETELQMAMAARDGEMRRSTDGARKSGDHGWRKSGDHSSRKSTDKLEVPPTGKKARRKSAPGWCARRSSDRARHTGARELKDKGHGSKDGEPGSADDDDDDIVILGDEDASQNGAHGTARQSGEGEYLARRSNDEPYRFVDMRPRPRGRSFAGALKTWVGAVWRRTQE